MNLTATAPASPITDVRFTWVTGGLGVDRRHELTVDFRTPRAAPDMHVTLTSAKGVPVWFGANAYADVENAGHRAALHDALVGSGLLQVPPSQDLDDPERGQLRVMLGSADDGMQPTWTGPLKQLPASLQAAWDAAQRFMDDATVAKRLGPGDLAS